MSDLILLGIVGAPHGVRGEVRIKTFTGDPLGIADYGPLSDSKGRSYEITDIRDALHWIAKNDKDAMTAFVEDYVCRNHKTSTITGVRVWQDKEAY